MTEPTPLYCPACGVEVAYPIQHEKQNSRGVEVRLPGGIVHVDERSSEHSFSRCAACISRLARAAAIIDGHARYTRGLGSRKYALALVDAALAALDALGVTPQRADSFARSDADLKRLIEYLAPFGDDAAWSARFTPIVRLDANQPRSEPARWSHLTTTEVASLREAYARFMAARVDAAAPPTLVPPPSDGAPGCLLCGVGAVEARHGAERDVWGGRRWQAHPGTLGGKAQPEPVAGYLCPTDTAIVKETGGLGPSAVERAYAAFLGEPLPGGWELEGVRAWAALPSGARPNRTPWAHEPHHEKTRAMIAEMREKARRGFVPVG